MNLTPRQSRDLDNHITGHYGEDQFKNRETVYEVDGEWYFSDETGDEHGPYKTKEEAEQECADYIAWLSGNQLQKFDRDGLECPYDCESCGQTITDQVDPYMEHCGPCVKKREEEGP